MYLEDIMLNEISQSQKDKYCTIVKIRMVVSRTWGMKKWGIAVLTGILFQLHKIITF